MRICIYPGTFDPVTMGHMDVIQRTAGLFDKVIIGIAEDNYKAAFFSKEERLEMLEAVTRDMEKVEVEVFSGLLMEYCRKKKATAVIRGLRAISDFEYEMQMAAMNKQLNPDVETVFLMTAQKYSFISSTIIKDVAQLQGDISGMVPPLVEERIKNKFAINNI
ncbi:MAG: pantetheine-phosphate adenylyltransferase [Bacillota bacterium]|nr:pantetheine-phosphate adenylyltransferase [Bacillota bacterium]